MDYAHGICNDWRYYHGRYVMGVVLPFPKTIQYTARHEAVEVHPVGIIKDCCWWSRISGMRTAKAGDKIYVPTSEARWLLNSGKAYNRGV